MVQWIVLSNKRHEKRWTLPLHSFSNSTSSHSMLHGHHCLLRFVEVSLNDLYLVMCLLVKRILEPHYWLRQRRRWIKFLSQLDQHGPHPESVLFLMDGRIQHAIHSSISWYLPKMDRCSWKRWMLLGNTRMHILWVSYSSNHWRSRCWFLCTNHHGQCTCLQGHWHDCGN